MKKLTLNEYGEQVVTMEKKDRGPLTEEEKQMIADLDNFDDVYDEDCPPMPVEMVEQMKKDIKARTGKGRLVAI